MRVLLPIDGSEAANEAVEFVRSLAEDNPVDVAVLVVSYDPVQYTMQPWVTEWTEQENLRTQTILVKAKEVLEEHCRSVSVLHGSGAVVPCILEQAKKSKSELIVLGAKGHTAIRRVLLGSVSDSIATGAECSVVVVRPQANQQHQLNKVVLAFDTSIASREAVTELMQLKLNRDTHVDVVSVAHNPYVYVGEGYIPEPITLTPEKIAPVAEAADRIASEIAEHFPHTQSHTPVADHVGNAIIDLAEKGNANLIVVGDTGRGAIGNFFLGSTSKYVLRHAACTVWISRHHWNATSPIEKATDAVAAR